MAGKESSNFLDPRVVDVADKTLLPDRRPLLADKDNFHFGALALADRMKGKDFLWTDDIEPGDLPSKISKRDSDALFAYRKEHHKVREELFALGAKTCQLPPSTPLLVTNLSGMQDLLLTFITADAAYAAQMNLASADIRTLLEQYLALAQRIINCEGSFIQTVVGSSFWGVANSYIAYFSEQKMLTTHDTSLLLQQSAAIAPDQEYFIQVLKREYAHTYLEPLSLIGIPLLARDDKKTKYAWAYLFDLKTSVDIASNYTRGLIKTVRDQDEFSENSSSAIIWRKQIDTGFEKQGDIKALTERLRLAVENTKADIPTDDLLTVEQYKQLKNYLGRVVLRMMGANNERRLEEMKRDALKVKLEIVRGAIITYQQMYKTFPNSLDQIVAKNILKSLPANRPIEAQTKLSCQDRHSDLEGCKGQKARHYP